MVSRKSLRIKSTSVLKKLKKRVGSKPKNSVGVQEVNLRRAAANSQIDTAREFIRTRRSGTSENKQKENRTSEIVTRRSKNVADQEDSRLKSCKVLAVKLTYPYISRTTSVELNNRSPNKNSNSSNALPSTVVKSPENDLNEQGASRKSSRMRKPTSKELKSILISTDDNKLELEKHNGEVSPKKHSSKSVKPQISDDTFTPDQKTQVGKVSSSGKKVKDDMECVRCGSTPSQFFGTDAEHNTICCICSLVKPPPELKALLQLLKLDCCLNVLNQKNQNALKSNNSPSRKRRMSGRTSKSDDEPATSSNNSDVRTLRERNAVKAQKEQHHQNSPEEQKQNASQFTRSLRQQKGNSTTNVNKPSNTIRSPNSAAASSTRISTRLTQKVLPQIKAPTRANKQTPPTIKNIQRNPKRKISPQPTQNPAKRRKLTETVEVKKNEREHICSSCNSTFAMQWKLKLHELTHSDRSYPNVVLRHAEIENTSHVTVMEEEHSEAMDCLPHNEDVLDKSSLNEQVSDPAVEQVITPEKLQENKSISDIENSMESGDDLGHSQAFKQGNEVKSVVENNEEIVNKNSKDTQNTQNTENAEAKIDGDPTNKHSTEVNQKLDAVDSHDAIQSRDTPSDEDNVEVNEDTDVQTKSDDPTLSASTDQSIKTMDDNFGKKPDLSSNFGTISLSTQEHTKDKVQDEMKPSETASDNGEEPKENRNVIEDNTPFDPVSDEDTALDQSEIQNIVKGLSEVQEENENSEESQEPLKAIEERETDELSKTNEGEHAAEDNENNEESEESMEATEEIQTHALSENNEDEHVGEENEDSSKLCDNAAGENTGIHEDEEDESSKMDGNCSKESVSVKNSSDHREHKDDRLVIEEESNSQSTANECSSVGETETEPKLNDDPYKEDVSENNEKKVNGTVSEDDDDADADADDEDDDDEDDVSKNTFESENASHPEVVSNHAADNTSAHPVDENMTELYNQMNMMFEEAKEGKTAKTETGKKSPDHLGIGDHSSESNDQNK